MDTTSLYFEGARRPAAGPARLQQGPSPRPQADYPRRGDRRRRPAGMRLLLEEVGDTIEIGVSTRGGR